MQETTNPAVTKWVEVKTEVDAPISMGSAATAQANDSNLYIEFYGLNMTVGNGYPVESLISLLREVCTA
ncbi:hypothetical protein FACS1894184_18870 [Clostridia bacterium]|nr:hypothetical protein FACS1894184_18870 [Clostridia bacterium]